MATLDPARTIFILTGASCWPHISHFDPAKAFSHTAEEVRKYLRSPQGLDLDKTHLLDLFDSDKSSTSMYKDIKTFVDYHLNRLNSKSGDKLVVFFWYIGHGALLGPEKDYCLLIRRTETYYAPESSLRVSAIAELFRQLIPSSSRIVVLDCCHAAQAAVKFQGGFEATMALQTEQAFGGGSGVAILAASSAKSPAQLVDVKTWTLFGRTLLDALNQGDPRYGVALSLRDVRELVLRALISAPIDHPPKPEVHCPNQKDLDLAGVPLFPNPAVPTRMVSMAVKPMAAPPADSRGLVSSLTRVEPVAKVASENDGWLQRLVLTGAPTAALAAARRLVELRGPTQLITSESTSTQLMSIAEWRLRVFREALKSDPHAAGAAILPLVREAHRDWPSARSAVELLSPALHDKVAGELARILRESPNPDNQRIAIEGLGRVGAVEYANLIIGVSGSPASRCPRGELELSVDSYQWRKLGSFLPRALARMARFEDRTVSLGVMPHGIRTLARFVEQHGADQCLTDAKAQVRLMGPEHADHVIAYWLNSDARALVTLGATALGHMRLLRGRQALINRIQRWGDFADPVVSIMAQELARIGGSVAYDWLTEHMKESQFNESISLCLDDVPENNFEKIVTILLNDGSPDISWRAYRAIGKRPLLTLLPKLNAALHSTDPADRGVGALALARARGTSVINQLRSAVAESDGGHERTLTMLALLTATRDPALVDELEEPLAEEAWRWEPVLFEDAIHILESCGGSRGADVARTLRWIASAP